MEQLQRLFLRFRELNIASLTLLFLHLTVLSTLLFADPTGFSLLLGCLVVLPGFSLLVWVYSGNRKNRREEMSTVYRFIRYPRVLGLFWILLSFTLSARFLWGFILLLILGGALFLFRKKNLEQMGVQGTALIDYERRVPSIFPPLWVQGRLEGAKRAMGVRTEGADLAYFVNVSISFFILSLVLVLLVMYPFYDFWTQPLAFILVSLFCAKDCHRLYRQGKVL